jgi:hypothetical protein
LVALRKKEFLRAQIPCADVPDFLAAAVIWRSRECEYTNTEERRGRALLADMSAMRRALGRCGKMALDE